MKIISVLGTRPELIKMSALIPMLDEKFDHILVHTGQHYSSSLDKKIRRDLGLRKPDFHFKMGAGSFGQQMARILPGLEKILAKEKPNLVLVQGDTNSGLAGALAATKSGIPVAHLEAGCRSGNLLSPEEQNRILIDSISEIHLAADAQARLNLKQEGKKSLMVGNTGIDAVLLNAKICRHIFVTQHGLQNENFLLATLHRAENTDDVQSLKERLDVIEYAARFLPVLLSLHPRTKAAMARFKIAAPQGVKICGPLPYLEFLSLLKFCRFALSDSGGIQEEAATLGKPCLVLRTETEWGRLIKSGKNFLVPNLNPISQRLIQRLAEDQSFYLRTSRKAAPGLNGGAARKVISAIKDWQCR